MNGANNAAVDASLPRQNCNEKNTRDQQNSGGLSKEEVHRSKQSLRGSRISCERRDESSDSSDEDTFENRRIGFQQQKYSNLDHKGILKVG